MTYIRFFFVLYWFTPFLKFGHLPSENPRCAPEPRVIFSVSVTMISNVTDSKHVAAPPSVFVQSVLIAALLKAGKFVKRMVPERLSLEYFDLQSITWTDFKDVEVFIEKESFTKGAF